jgi:hypothetical protein
MVRAVTARSTIDVEFLRGEWMVVQRMNAEDAREVAYGLSPRDGAREDLLKAADEIDQKNRERP